MVRVLQLFSKSADFQTEAGVAQLDRGAGDAIACQKRTIGYVGDYASVLAGVIGFRRHGVPADLIHAWGEAALVTSAIGAQQPIVYSPTEFPRRRSIRWLRSIMNYRDVQVVCPTDTMRRAFVEHGVPIERCHLLRPGVDFARINPRRDPTLRASLGFGEDDLVLLAVGESTRPADHERTAWAAVLLHVLDRKNRLLIWGHGSLAQKTLRFVHRLQQPDLCSIAADRLGGSVTFEQLLPAVDVAVITASGPVSTLPIAVCMAAALPIVAVVSSTISELLEDRHNALLVSTASPRAIARRVLDVREDTNLQWAIRDMARTEAYEYFSQTRFVTQFRAIYRQVHDGAHVEIPQPAAGAGARFHGVAR